MIFLDNASTTKPFQEVLKFMKTYSEQHFYNPSSLYKASLDVKNDIENARTKLMNMLNVQNSTCVFTASATEANNFILRCFLKKNQKLLISSGEHSCVYETACNLKDNGVEVEFIALNSDGSLDLDDLKEKLTENTGLVSVLHVNNETGAINDLSKISKIIKEKRPQAIFHSDGVQAFCKIKTDLSSLGVDAYTISSHKIHGPRGVGALIYKKNLNPKTFIFGGGQEYNLRSGTENTPAILGFVMAAEIMQKNLTKNLSYVNALRQSLLQKIETLKPITNGMKDGSPYILSLGFEGVKGEVLVHMLEGDDILIGTGSSCNSKHKGNRVMVAMGKSKKEEASNIRISFCSENTQDEIDVFAEKLEIYINKIRELDIWKR